MSTIRAIIETIARGRKIKRRLPNGINLFVSPDSQLKYLKSNFDPDLIEFAEKHVSPETVVWDVGANCGVFAFSCAAAKQVVAIEADPFLTNLIQETSMMNGVPIVLIGAAASSETGIAEFTIARRGRASNHLSSVSGRSQTGGERARMLVPTVTLDMLLDKLLAPSVIKIDVEGAETQVLEGAQRILNEIRPTLYLETGEESHDECVRILESANYRLSKGAEMNWLCIPIENSAER